jgi:hypothetical protein
MGIKEVRKIGDDSKRGSGQTDAVLLFSGKSRTEGYFPTRHQLISISTKGAF